MANEPMPTSVRQICQNCSAVMVPTETLCNNCGVAFVDPKVDVTYDTDQLVTEPRCPASDGKHTFDEAGRCKTCGYTSPFGPVKGYRF